MKKSNILLIGMPGSGKSTTGVVLAKLQGLDFIDTDLIMGQRLKLPLSMLASRLGYEGFIREEGLVGESICCQNTVIATGGSMPLSENAMLHLCSISRTVWLRLPPQELKKRIPLNLEARGVVCRQGQGLAEILREREPYYSRYADIVVDCRGSCDDVAHEIIERLATD